MESWSYLSEGKAFAFDDLIPPSNLLGRNKNPCMGWELKASCGYEDNLIVPGQEGNGNQGFGDLGFPEMMLKRLPDEDLIRYDLGCKDGGGRMAKPVMPAPPVSSMPIPHASSGESSTSRFSGSVVESNSRESSFIDLKLGRFTDDRNARNCFSLSRAAPSLSPAESTTPTRRLRAVSLTQQNPFCQVLGCNKDLSSSKDYHKRHKVCEVHTKTAKVTVNGIEQRFCQQCSRFHLLVEFDNGKRSCRKRLAGHNERRRKPQAGNSHQNNRWLQPYNGNSINGSALLPGGLLHLKKYDAHVEKYEANRWYKRIRHGGDAASDNGHQLAITPANTLLHPKPNFLSFNFEKQYYLFNDNGANASTKSIFSESNDCYPRNLRGPSSASRSLSQNTSLGRDDVAAFDTVSSFQPFAGIPGSGCALSLLSSQAQDASIHSSGITLASSMMRPGNGSDSPYNVNQISGRLLEVSPRASTTMLLSNRFPSSGMSSGDGNHLGSVLISDVRGHDTGGFEDEDGVFQGLDFMNARGRFSCQDGATINLLELSSQLQRVEDQKQSMQMKQENDAFCGL